MLPRRSVAGFYAAVVFLVSLDATAVQTILPAIGKTFGATWGTVGTAQISYLAGASVSLPLAGWIGDRYGLRRGLMAAFTLFAAGAFLCAASDRFGMFTISRGFQGVGSGLSVPLVMAVLFRTYPPDDRVSLLRTLTVPIAAAPAVGPLVGGLLTDGGSWRFLFGFEMVAALAVLGAVWKIIPFFPRKSAMPLDTVGFVLSAVGFAGLVYASAYGQTSGWASADVIVATAVAAGSLVGFAVRQRKYPYPLLNVTLFHEPTFRTSALVSALGSAGLLGMVYTVALVYQTGDDGSALRAGSVVFWEAIGLMVSARTLPRLYRRFGARPLTAFALTMAAFVVLAAAWTGVSRSPWFDSLAMFSVGFALGHAAGATQLIGFSRVPPAETGQATTLYQVMSRLGSAFGVAAASMLIGTAENGSTGDGFSALTAVALLWLVAAALTIGVWRSGIEATGEPKK